MPEAVPADDGAELEPTVEATDDPQAVDEPEAEQELEREDPLANVAPGELAIDGMAIRADEPFPLRHTCQENDLSPPLRWSAGPDETKSYALVFTDLDADLNDGVFVHWVLWDIPADVNSLEEDLGSDSNPPMVPGAKQVRGWSSCLFGAPDASYLGPCSPTDPHSYEFALYALNVEELPDADVCQQPIEIRDAIEASGAVIASTTLTAVYTP